MPKQPQDRVAGKFFTWNLFRRDDVWYADGRHNSHPAGKHTLGTRDRQKALQRIYELDHQIAVRLKLTASVTHEQGEIQLTIEEGWDRYMAHAARSSVLGGTGERTQKRYRAVRDKHRLFCQSHGVRTWKVVDRASVQKYAEWLSKRGLADNTIYLEGTLLKQVVKWLIEEEKALPESSRIRLQLRRSMTSETHCYTREQVKAMRDLCLGNSDLHWLADVIVALATTGMRIGELAGLRWSDVNLDAGVIVLPDNRHSDRAKRAGAVRTTKGRRSRTIHVHDDLRGVLRALPHRAEGGPVFRALEGGVIRPDKVLKILKRDVIEPLKARFATPLNEVGFEHGGVHSFRHYFVTEAFAGGATEGEVRDWVGHRDSRIVERYRHLREQNAKRTMRSLNFLSGDDNQAMPNAPAAIPMATAEISREREADGPNGSEPR